jgi:(p)ppGpp synthase/HD superfamily hydrolase
MNSTTNIEPGYEDEFLTTRYRDALVFSFDLHQQQLRKSSTVPYFAHLMSVSALVLEYGGSEDEAIAGLLHDAVEDQGGLEILQEIRDRYGDKVASVVEECSDSFTNPKPPWLERKITYLEHMKAASPSTRRVSLADKLHNLRDILATYRRAREDTWQRFKGGKEGTLWYYDSLVQIFESTGSDEMTQELRRVFEELLEIMSAGNLNSNSKP